MLNGMDPLYLVPKCALMEFVQITLSSVIWLPKDQPWASLSRGQSHSTNVNHCIHTNLTRMSTGVP